MKMPSINKQTDNLLTIAAEVWDTLNICCGQCSAKGNDKHGYSVEEKKVEHDALIINKVKKLGYSSENKVPDAVRRNLENENSHSLNRVLTENELGEGNY